MMDTSKEYILQCEKAGEIQKLKVCKDTKSGREFDIGDIVIDCMNRGIEWVGGTFNKAGKVQTTSGYYTTRDYDEEMFIWLPTQDQLQEMVEYSVWFEKIYRFYEWLQYSKEGETPCVKFDSMEQLWLAFVMSERYQKHWSGTDWVKK